MTTYKTNRICYKCESSDEESLRLSDGGDWIANCTDCGIETKGENLVLLDGFYVCNYCENKKYANYNRTDVDKMEPCVFCGDFEPSDDMFLFNSYKICTHCNDYEKSHNTQFTL